MKIEPSLNRRCLLYPAFLVLGLLACFNVSALTLTKGSISWTITGTPTSGAYADGSPWVVGPITITAISPTPTEGRNGTMVNPVLTDSYPATATQGFDNRIGNNPYSEVLNVGNNLPLAVGVNSSVLSSVSKSTSPTYGVINELQILTVVAAAPAPGSFRPGYLGTGSRASTFTVADLDYGRLNKFPTSGLSSVPNISTVAGYFHGRVWFEMNRNWTGRELHLDYMALNGYGKDMANRAADAALLLNLDYPDAQKEQLLIGMVQYGLDIAHIVAGGGSWGADGGHQCGRLTPLMIAAAVLDDPALKGYLSASLNKFQEYQQTFFVTSADVGRTYPTVNGQTFYHYTAADIGKPEWAVETGGSNPRKNNRWDANYRDIAGGVMPAAAVLARNLGLESSVGTGDAFFRYAQRHIYYRQSRYANPVYYNGYDDGDAYGEGNNERAAPFGYNETPAFHTSYYFAHEFDGPSGGGTPDVIPPNISAISTNSLTSASVNIVWNTDEPATSGVEYGPTTAYGSSVTNSALVNSHSLSLVNLNVGTTYHFRISSTDRSGNKTTTADRVFTTSSSANVVAPGFTPGSGSFIEPQGITLSTPTAGASIHYTTDGTVPDTADPLYAGPVAVTNTVTLRAVALKAGSTPSPVQSASYNFGPFTSLENWLNIPFASRTNRFVLAFTARPSASGMDAVIALGQNPASFYTDSAVLVRFSDAGVIDARNGGAYQAETPVSYLPGVDYRFVLDVDVASRTYDVAVTPVGGSAVVIGRDFAFRTEQANLASFSNFCFMNGTPFGSVRISDVSFGGSSAPSRPARVAGVILSGN